MTNHSEVEVKLPIDDLAAFRRLLARSGAKSSKLGRMHELNILFDTPQGGLAKHGQLLRLRFTKPASKAGKKGKGERKGADPGARVLLTYKGPATRPTASDAVSAGRYKVREEIETAVAEPEKLSSILEALGLRGWFRYEKYRTSFRLPGPWAKELVIDLDETPIGTFAELEGPPEAIDRAATLLGYRRVDYITKTYLALHLEQCRKRGVPTSDMTFSP